MGYLVDWYREITLGRSAGRDGVDSLSWTEIKAWSEIHDTQLESWEIGALWAMEEVFMGRVVHLSNEPTTLNPEQLPKFDRKGLRRITTGKKPE